MKETLEKSKRSCKYTEKFKIKCGEIIRQFNLVISIDDYQEIFYNVNHDDLNKEKDEIIRKTI